MDITIVRDFFDANYHYRPTDNIFGIDDPDGQNLINQSVAVTYVPPSKESRAPETEDFIPGTGKKGSKNVSSKS